MKDDLVLHPILLFLAFSACTQECYFSSAGRLHGSLGGFRQTQGKVNRLSVATPLKYEKRIAPPNCE